MIKNGEIIAISTNDWPRFLRFIAASVPASRWSLRPGPGWRRPPPPAAQPAGAAPPRQRRHRREVVEDRHLDGLRRGRRLAVIAVEADEDVAGVWLRWVINRPARRRPSQAVGRGADREAERHVARHFLLRGGQDLGVAVVGVATRDRV